MKIAVVGSHSTGKTTLCKGIAEMYGYNVIVDVSRIAHKLKFEVNENTPPESQFWILSKQIELERNTPTPWVSDKALWDNIIYGEFAISDKEVNKVIKKIVIANAEYDIVFYCPIEFSLKEDGVRSANSEFQKVIDKKYIEFLKRYSIKYIEVRGNESERLNKAKRIISYRNS